MASIFFLELSSILFGLLPGMVVFPNTFSITLVPRNRIDNSTRGVFKFGYLKPTTRTFSPRHEAFILVKSQVKSQRIYYIDFI
jgi:hypothetical protein